MAEPPFKIDNWQLAAAERRQSLYESIPNDYRLPTNLSDLAIAGLLRPEDQAVLQCGILSDLDMEITNITDAPTLVSLMASRQYTAVQVTQAFCKRAAIAQQCLGCLTVFLYESAMRRATELDDYMAQTGKSVGILHGLPICLKDIFDIQGQPTTVGLVSWLPYIATKNATITDSIIAAGGILLAKTSTSQACLMVESINNIFGTVRNPYNPQLSAGGSSGGEAALVAAKGSILGSGTDGGGSIRFPAAFCGLWGIKCSKGRIPAGGCSGPKSGNESVNSGFGPLAKTVASLEVWLRAQLASQPWDVDSSCIPMKWDVSRAERAQGPLTIAVIWDDGVVKPAPPVVRALKIVVDLLKKNGHRIVHLPEEKIKDVHRRATSCFMMSNVQDGGFTVMKHIDSSGEPVVPRTATGSLESRLTAREIFDNHLLRSSLGDEYNDLWQHHQMDAILAPAVAHPAPPHGKYISNSYASIYNMLDYVTGCIPVGSVDLELDKAPPEWYQRQPYDRIEPVRFPYDLGDKEMMDLYSSPEVFKNSPIGVQIVCRRLKEEKCIGILKEIERIQREGLVSI
ncbi:hypothetical protein UA08_08361 [Talaromyces atroroseus]|uniref:amidase n=1 Tax=Talaromyces atroroseus TaxID=1441469 RepID=A0A225ANG2_TALAT|nr:hypothetical protein UA08_08361 [Talaromyces atroroseus]OKL56486.1 hypothetical protein UA08_08361 [Talaromyces atroroseus]